MSMGGLPGGKVGGSGRGWQPTGIGGADNGQKLLYAFLSLTLKGMLA
jgi:hypothetical protein